MQEYIRRDKKQIVGKQSLQGSFHKKQHQEQAKKYVQKQQTDERKEKKQRKEGLKEYSEKSKKIIFQCRSIFPFDLFPDEIMVDTLNLTYIHNSFFVTADTQHIRLDDIEDASMTSAAFIGRVEISIKDKDPLIISSLSKRNATRLKNILLGLVRARKNDIQLEDLSSLKTLSEVVKLGEKG